MCERNDLTESLYFRHACKRFDPTRTLPAEDLRFILEAGRLAPSSFGMEPWEFLVIEDREFRRRLQPLCWNQPQIEECSALVAIVGRIGAVRDPEYYRAMFARRGLDAEATEAYVRRYEEYLVSLESIGEWVLRQCYIAADHMMVYASLIGVDSCPIEGFEPAGVGEMLGVDPQSARVALLLPLGYRIQPAPPKKRRPFGEVVRFV
ncbi:NAD(P)H-dependent oxidoreductase [Nitratifractor sp.]